MKRRIAAGLLAAAIGVGFTAAASAPANADTSWGHVWKGGPASG